MEAGELPGEELHTPTTFVIAEGSMGTAASDKYLPEQHRDESLQVLSSGSDTPMDCMSAGVSGNLKSCQSTHNPKRKLASPRCL